MKKLLLLVLSAIVSVSLWAEQMPKEYYDAINGKKDAELKTTLSEIIKGGERLPYGTEFHSTTKVDPETGDTIWKKNDPKPCTWSGFYMSDRHSNETVWDMYSSTVRYFPLPSGSAAGMDIEHSLPKSWWGGDVNDAYKDLYHLCPADRVANNNKSNYAPGVLKDSAKVNNGYFFMGKDETWNDNAFVVSDEYKGDFARAYFYIATAYEDLDWKADFSKYINKDSYLRFTPHLVDVLLAWHRIDPVSEKEVNRLNAISDIQHNRNAFIEYPELVEYIWGEKKGQVVNLSALQCTTDGTYDFPVSDTDPLAHQAKDVTADGFLASWSNTGSSDYELDVFTLTTTGKNDTLVAMKGFKNYIINENNKLSWLEANGTTAAPFTNMDGTFAVCTSTTTAKRQLRISNFGAAPENTKLDVKCCVFKSDLTADLVIKGDGDAVLYEIPLVLDEVKYTFDIPKGTQQISIMQKEVGSAKNYHRISLQQAFLYSGDEKTTETSISGFPVTVSDLEYQVNTPLTKGTKVYYRVKPKGLRATNTVEVSYNDDPSTAVESVCNRQEETQKIIEKGQVIIIREGVRYNVLGIKLN